MKPRILIVDDEENIRKALHRWFEISGFDVDTAEDGVAAVELCAGTQYDVVTMDLEMPRMNGKEAIAAIKLLQPDVPILMLTGYPQNSAEVLNCGALKILTKPFRLQELEQEVRSVL
ncbi:MAG: response regulator [Candidatus Hydrogenedentes bacterium]|nr:response regulator [Candidatus Hydrogenedentota bacterium]